MIHQLSSGSWARFSYNLPIHPTSR